MKGIRRGARLRFLIHDQRGATAVEYGLILALMFLALLIGVTSLGSAVKGRWDGIANRMSAT